MTTLSAGAAAGLLVALMAVATNDSRAAELTPVAKLDNAVVQLNSTRSVYPLRAARSIGKLTGETAFTARI